MSFTEDFVSPNPYQSPMAAVEKPPSSLRHMIGTMLAVMLVVTLTAWSTIMLDITDTVPGSVAIEMRVVPVREIGSTLVLATDSRPTTETKSRLVYILNRKVRFVLRSHDWMESQLDARYGSYSDSLDAATTVEGISWYWPSWHYFDGDTLIVKVSGWEGMTRWTGAQEIPASHPDREFWEWLITMDYYSKGLLDEREIPKIKRIWNRYRQRTNTATSNPIIPSDESGVS